ncbi:DNA-binding CsgD family transcriptional regulator/PAS domain-containing protein [Azospirillum agricola]|uniref:helix-turn-helix transcriptional regulator n=1 Tax=Azospirillum agricola TaxID=1720247 RepID=UPI001AE334D3|nr:hypothetical protein [Azospirillum agricola]MBP2232260.1 DNA-binding CsgD family transcriptional regulator/PAS domain-containing protein [Azospirillum agricola]
MSATQIPKQLDDLIGTASEMQGAILVYRNDVVVFANELARSIHAQQDWSAPVTFDGIFRKAIELGRIDDRIILDDPPGHLVYAKMVRMRESHHSFQRRYDGLLYHRHHVGLDREWNAQIWVRARSWLEASDDLAFVSAGLEEQVEQNRALAGMTALLDRMGIAMAVVAADGRVIDCSPLMASHFRDGTLISLSGGDALECRDKASTAQLRRAVAAVADGREQAVLIPVPMGDGVQPLAVMSASPTDRTAIVVVQDIARSEPLEDILVAAYGLKKSQAEVVVRVAGGETADDIAAALNRPYDTVKRQIATSKAKIAAGRQHGLAHIVTRVAALFGGISSSESRRKMQ